MSARPRQAIPVTAAVELIGELILLNKEKEYDFEEASRVLFEASFHGKVQIWGICDGCWSVVPNKWDQIWLINEEHYDSLDAGGRHWSELMVDVTELSRECPALAAQASERAAKETRGDVGRAGIVWQCLGCLRLHEPAPHCRICGLIFNIPGKDYDTPDPNPSSCWPISFTEMINPHVPQYSPGFEQYSGTSLNSVVTPSKDYTSLSEQRVKKIPTKRGRIAKYSWEAMYIEIIRIVNRDCGLPDRQAHLMKEVQDWFNERFNAEPPESSIKERIREIYLATKGENAF